jgi:uncharacterized repeat protein (TIGR01451 family)
MKKGLLLLIILSLKFASSKAQWVTIPDPNFVIWLQQNYPSCMNGNQMNTNCAPIVNDTSVSIWMTSISNLTGIEHFINLTDLMCSDNQLNTLPALPPNLIQLGCQNNQLTSLPPLPATLKLLWCDDNQLTSLPTIPDSLLILFCYGNQLNSLSRVPAIMQDFLIGNNNISCLVNLPLVTGSADISNNPITCVPNQTSYSLGLPFCQENDTVNNPNNCQSVNISGHVFTDLNSNCQWNNSDLPTNNFPVKLFDSQNNLIATNYTTNGRYSFSVLQTDSFSLKIEDNLFPVAMSCGQQNIQTVAIDSLNQLVQGINFPVICDSLYDINIQGINSQGWVFPGQQHAININIGNNVTWFNIDCNSSLYTGTVTIDVTGPVNFNASTSNALVPIVSGNIFTYSNVNFANLNPNSFGLIFTTDTTANTGSQICVHAELSPTPIDGNTTNNTYDFCYNVVNSYDPNMKEVYPINVLPGYDDWFTYTINFQNTGNAPAFNIRLRDTLDTQLDLNTFEVLGYSHPATTSLYGNILTVRFNDIMLSDSSTDYNGSMGYFQYRIKPFSNLPLGAQIENTAYIYFDYNTPIVTNTTQNNFDNLSAVNHYPEGKNQFKLYPNPSNGIFSFTDYSNLETVEVYTLLGEQIVSQTTQKQINLSSYSKGIYFARINGEQVIKLVKE